MALVNIGVELSRMGKKVLLVDFDLEAPGLETFNILKGKDKNEGVVDYIYSYLKNDISPDISNYTYQPKDLNNIWVMPAGKRDYDYSNKFNSINWNELYEKHNGYVMFEDLKAQWEKYINPEYVLLDSRTGHTDIGGICTRQLPDGVVVFYFPNEQNLKGLETVVNDIRNEASGKRRKKIVIHFVTSNVPDLDDEDRILEYRLKQFINRLNIRESAITIHHYNSLSLLNQTVFTIERPKSRLAQEYKSLLKRVIRYNNEDSVGVLDYLKYMKYAVDAMDLTEEDGIGYGKDITNRKEERKEEFEDRFEKILKINEKNGEILYRLGLVREKQGNFRDAFSLYRDAYRNGLDNANVIIKIIEMQSFDDSIIATSSEYIEKLLSQSNMTSQIFNRLLVRLDDEKIEKIYSKEFYITLGVEGKIEYAKKLIELEKYEIAKIVIHDILKNKKDLYYSGDSLKTDITLILIRIGEYEDVMDILTNGKYDWSALSDPALFNYGMAAWGKDGNPKKEIFRKVLEIEANEDLEKKDPNYCQCLSLASAICGETEKHKHYLENAYKKIKEEPYSFIDVFSAWRYCEVDSKKFIKDLDAIKNIALGRKIKPLFIRRKRFILN